MGLNQDQRGAASLLGLFMIVAILAVGALSVDLAGHFWLKVAVEQKLNLACRSAAAQLNEEDLKNLLLVIDQDRAARSFYEVLRANLVLDAALAPRAGSILKAGAVQVEYFKVINPADLPFTYTWGGYAETVNRTAVAAVISFPVKSGFLTQLAGGAAETIMYCHITAAPELISRPADQI